MRTQTVSQSVTSQTSALCIAFELGAKSWKLALSDGFKAKPRLVSLEAGALAGVERHIARARSRFSRMECYPVLTCYEAGRDSFWIHRALERRGIHNVVVDPASIEVNRRFRRAKTDRLDATKLVSMLMRYHRGESRVGSVVRVPGVVEIPAAKRVECRHRGFDVKVCGRSIIARVEKPAF